MKKHYIQPILNIHYIKAESAFMAGPSKGEGGDYTGDSEYNGSDPNVNPDSKPSEELGGLPGGNE